MIKLRYFFYILIFSAFNTIAYAETLTLVCYLEKRKGDVTFVLDLNKKVISNSTGRVWADLTIKEESYSWRARPSILDEINIGFRKKGIPIMTDWVTVVDKKSGAFQDWHDHADGNTNTGRGKCRQAKNKF